MNTPKLFFTEADSARAHEEWKANCGPHSIAAACGITLDEARKHIPNFRGWMNPTQIGDTLLSLGQSHVLNKGLNTQALCEGVNRVQWVGPWLAPGVPARVAYRHTHYVAHRNGFVLCTACRSHQWIPASAWLRIMIEEPEPTPFYITHHWIF